jgi:transposase
MALRVRPLTADEAATIGRVARSRTEPARRVERAQMIQRAASGESMGTIAAVVGCNVETVRLWVKRFHAAGLAGRQDRPRRGRPATDPAAQVGAVVAAALTKPAELGLPFASWTLDRLAAYLAEEQGIGMKRSRIGELRLAEGLRWRTQETWFGERPDPEFARKRGRS